MKIRARAPLRLGLAGGGTDVSPYSDEFGGIVLNGAVNLYAYCTIEPTHDGVVEFHAVERSESMTLASADRLDLEGGMILYKAVYNAVSSLAGRPLSFRLSTWSDAPAGSGLGTSSTLVVAMLSCFAEWLKLPFGQYDLAHLAFQIERMDAGLKGGKQDQYAATFGGFNYIEFFAGDRVIVNPLRVQPSIISEFESSLVLYYTGRSRDSHRIIEEQMGNAARHDPVPLNAMHQLKRDAVSMKECLLKGDIRGIATLMAASWEAKRNLSTAVSNAEIDGLLARASENGAIAGKISGAGGGGFIIFMVDPVERHRLIHYLGGTGGRAGTVSFSDRGAESWIAR